MVRFSLNTMSIKAFAILTVFVLSIGLLLGHAYQGVANVISGPPWMAALLVHTVMSAGILVVVWRDSRLRPVLAYPPVPARFLPAFYWSIPVVVLAGTALLATATRLGVPGATSAAVPSVQWAWILVVPVAEEIVFRLGIGTGFRRWGGPLWGAWFSSILFAWVHTQPSWESLWSGELGLPMGPFLLGLACEAMLVCGRSLYPVIFLHAACNGTVVVFSAIDARWLSWLGYLYG